MTGWWFKSRLLWIPQNNKFSTSLLFFMIMSLYSRERTPVCVSSRFYILLETKTHLQCNWTILGWCRIIQSSNPMPYNSCICMRIYDPIQFHLNFSVAIRFRRFMSLKLNTLMKTRYEATTTITENRKEFTPDQKLSFQTKWYGVFKR